MSKSPAYIAAHVRRVLRDGGSAPHSAEVQRFFKEEIQSRGWYANELRKVAARVRRSILREEGLAFLVAVADRLFRGRVLEEKVFAVYLLQKSVTELGTNDFERLESWLDRVGSWADHDALVSYLIGPLLLRMPQKLPRVFVWAGSPQRWHRRAAAVALIRGAREGKFGKKSRASPANSSPSLMTWCGRASVGCCANSRSLTPVRLSRCFGASKPASLVWCCAPPAKPCQVTYESN